jgi:type II secretory pathway component PulJ
MKHLFNHSAGDTIVEVLIAMAVASSVLGGAYVVVNRTMANTRQAQEHTEALQLANGQIERLIKLTASGSSTALQAAPTYKCISEADNSIINQPALVKTDSNSYAAGCKNLGSVNYRLALEYVIDSTGSKFYRVYVIWPSATGNGDDQVSLVYRTYE